MSNKRIKKLLLPALLISLSSLQAQAMEWKHLETSKNIEDKRSEKSISGFVFNSLAKIIISLDLPQPPIGELLEKFRDKEKDRVALQEALEQLHEFYMDAIDQDKAALRSQLEKTYKKLNSDEKKDLRLFLSEMKKKRDSFIEE